MALLINLMNARDFDQNFQILSPLYSVDPTSLLHPGQAHISCHQIRLTSPVHTQGDTLGVPVVVHP